MKGDIKVISHLNKLLGNELVAINQYFLHARMFKDLREAISYADKVHDYVSRDMMIEILADEEHHIDWIETELELIQKMGIQNYLQAQIKQE